MSHSDAELLRLVREWRPPATLHPIAMQAWHIYEDGGKRLSGESVQALRVILDGYGDLVQLGEAIEGLVRFSILLSDHEHDAEGAHQIVALMREYTPRFEPFFERVSAALASAGFPSPVAPNRRLDTGQAASSTSADHSSLGELS